MKIHVLGDLHNEFMTVDTPSTVADLVVLAGDVAVGLDGLDYAKRNFAKQTVLYVAGNHEYYGKSIPRLTQELRASAANSNVRFLEQEEIIIDGVRFLGCTLWTDFDLFGPDRREEALVAAGADLNDYVRITRSRGHEKLTPGDTLLFNAQARKWLAAHLVRRWDGPTVVVTHHAPSRSSIPPMYRDDLLSAAFASDLEPLIIEAGPDLWIHGHTHHCVDYRIGRTRVLSNQRGYPHEKVMGFVPGLVVELMTSSG